MEGVNIGAKRRYESDHLFSVPFVISEGTMGSLLRIISSNILRIISSNTIQYDGKNKNESHGV